MQYRVLGRSGLRVSEIGQGTWAFASHSYGDVSEDAARATIDTALEAGINFFDTAPLYGDENEDGIAETILGRALGKRRDQAVISTKFGRNPTDGCRPAFHAQRLRQSVDDSLRRLNTDRLDVLFFHSPFSPDEINDDIWEALDEVKRAGKVLAVGHSISMFRETQQMARDWAAERRIDVIQVVLSLLNREAAALIADLGRQGIGVVARESLANGFLTGAVTRETVFPPNNLNSRYSREEIAERVEQVERLGFLVRGEIKTVAQAAMRWVLDQPGVTLVLTGAKNAQEAADCAAASDAAPYSAEELAKARTLHRKDYPGA
jgi:aryl-alcohol dehydrogenase-like predicted oxidoreductase